MLPVVRVEAVKAWREARAARAIPGRQVAVVAAAAFVLAGGAAGALEEGPEVRAALATRSERQEVMAEPTAMALEARRS